MLSEKLKRRLFCVFYLAIILWLTPLCIFWSLVFWLFGRKKYEENLLPGHLRRRILITGDTATKAVHIIRALGKAGHTVIIADWVGPWSVLRWSRYVSKVYSVSSNQTEYVQQVINIGVHEKVDYFIPVIKKDYAMADARIGEYLTQKNIKCLVSNPTQIEQLDEKIDFMRKCKEYGLSVPEFVDSEEKLYSMASDGYFQDRFFFFKPSACSSVFRNSFERIPADLTQIQNFMKSFRDEIFFAQEYIHGTELSANLLSKDGEIVQLNLAHSSPIQVDYDVIQHPKITKWVTDFCRKTNLTGAVCFDFIEDKMGDIYCLECNPRFHSSLVNYIDTKSFERSLLSLFEETQLHFSKPLHPNPNIFTYWFYQEFFRMLTLKRSMIDFFKILAFGYEALWDSSDPIPYIVYHHAQIPVSLMKHILTGEYWECVNFCLGRVMY